MKDNVQVNYGWQDSIETETNILLFPLVIEILSERKKELTILDIGCGNGTLAKILSEHGHIVVGVDTSEDGVKIARKKVKNTRFDVCSIYDDDFHKKIGSDFDIVIALEVIEHLYWPRILLQKANSVLVQGGTLILSTPYHGYVKNLALSILNGWDKHFTVDWDGGHIKFFSKVELKKMLEQQGFSNISFQGAGRFPYVWKSMLLTGVK